MCMLWIIDMCIWCICMRSLDPTPSTLSALLTERFITGPLWESTRSGPIYCVPRAKKCPPKPQQLVVFQATGDGSNQQPY